MTLETSGPVTSPTVIDYRWSDLAQNAYAPTYVDSYDYDAAVVTVTYETGEPTFTGHLSATNLKPNFAYQVKLVGKPEGLFDPISEGGDDVANERIGYAGRWWEAAPGTGNRTDAYYETYKNDPAYIFEAYLLFDFFLTDADGNAELDFALNSSYHVLFWDWQGGQGVCDQPLKTTIVSGSSADPAYDEDVGPTAVGVYPQIERLCNGQTALPAGNYNCRLLLTEESFHTADGNWAPALIGNDIQFNIGAGLFPPVIKVEPAFTGGSENSINWYGVSGATQYDAECSTVSDFSTLHASSGPIVALSTTFTGLAEGQIYYYRVKASDGTTVESAWSATVFSTQDGAVPSSAVGALPPAHTGSSLSIPYSAMDALSGVHFVRLYYRVASGAYVQYGGTFSSSPINFVIPGDGAYGFYTVATDRAGNQEAAPGWADASSVLTVAAAADPVGNADYVDVGDPTSEAGHAFAGWGPIEPDTHGGGWGGIGSESPPGKCRTIWSPEEGAPVERWAEVLLDFGPAGGTKTLWLRHLDGGSIDSFDVLLDGSWVASVPDVTAAETWFWAAINATGYDGVHTVRFAATGDPGSYWNPYGQVGFDIITICGAPALFEALPVDSAPIACGQSKQVAFHFTQGCEYIRGYSLRVRSTDGLSFDDARVTVHDPSGTGDATSSVIRNAVNDWTITYTINGDSVLPAGIPSDSDLFSIEFLGVSAGTGQVVIESVNVEPLVRMPPPVLDSVGAAIAVTCGAPAAPAAVTALTAEPGNRRIEVSWQDPPDADLVSLEIWRGLWYDDDGSGASAYPEYGNLPNDVIPARPIDRAGAFTSPQWELAGTVQPGEQTFRDVDGQDGLLRGIYYYEVFAVDAEGLFGPRAAANDRATSYLPGDLDGDGAITLGPDITGGLALCYGTREGEAGYEHECDVGPTDDYSGTGIPLPDNSIDFDDLMVSAVNFDTVLDKAPTNARAFARFAWTEVEANIWSLRLVASNAGLKGLNLAADLPAGAVLSLSAGEALAGLDCPIFLRNIDRNGLDVGLVLLGDGAWIRTSGELLRVTMAAGRIPIEPVVDARDARNAPIVGEIETVFLRTELPVRHRIFPNYPNPFNPTTRITFELPVTEPVELAIFGLDGRRVVTLMDRALPAGRHTVTWTGRDEKGDLVASGTYVYRLRAGEYAKTCKMVLLK